MAFRQQPLPPNIPERLWANSRISNGIRNTDMTEVVLKPPRIHPLVRQGVAALTRSDVKVIEHRDETGDETRSN